jgi:hypothetical protein
MWHAVCSIKNQTLSRIWNIKVMLMIEENTTAKSPLWPLLVGLFAAVGMVSFYLGLITLTSDWYYAKTQFDDFRWWILSLSAGFGTQAGLFFHLRRLSRARLKVARSTVTASGGLSTMAMALCCSHYLATFLPVVGLPFLSAALSGVGQYQVEFFLLGLVSNTLGIGYMLPLIAKGKAIPAGGVRQ